MSRHSLPAGRARAPVVLATFALLLDLAGCGKRDQPEPSTPAASTREAVEKAVPATSRPVEATATPPPVTEPRGLVLTELLYRPAPGAAPFIELENVGRQPVVLKPLALLIGTEAVPLAEVGDQLAPGARVLVVFDGPRRREGSAYHVGEDIRISAEAGRAAIVDSYGKVVDDVAWGGAPGAVNPIAGGGKTDVEPGESIGRPPGATRPRSALAWVGYAANDVSPGKANPPAAVRTLHPMNGAALSRSDAALSWIAVPGAKSYRVQVATDESFAKVVFEQSTDRPRMKASALPSGRYTWRVQAQFDGGSSAWSSASDVTLLETPAGKLAASSPGRDATQRPDAIDTLRALGRRAFGFLIPSGLAQTAAPVLNTFTCPQTPVALLQEACVALGVPLIKQHKDTQMLLLEQDTPSGAPHPWDADHGDLDEDDPADNANCGLASLAMMNHHAGGDLSQDRIGFEVLEGEAPGPELDLMHGEGLYPHSQMVKAYAYALGTSATYQAPRRADGLWADMKNEIEHHRPMLVYSPNPSHFFVIAGYRLRGGHRIFLVNDPWDGFVEIDLDDAKVGGPFAATWFYYIPGGDFRPRMQEASVLTDGDGDGVVDFDETKRFHTSPGNNDTDADAVNDKHDVAASVFDAQYGYARNRTGRDEDHDGRPMELDPDSDDGGCKDGDEDKNGDGIYEGAVVQQVETWNFKFLDDSCKGLAGHLTRRFRQTGITSPIIEWSEADTWTGINVRLKPVDDQPGSYEDDGSRYQHASTGFARYIIGECRVDVRVWAGSSGDFTGRDAAPATAQITDDGRLGLHFVTGIPVQHTGAWTVVSPAVCKRSGLDGSGYSANPPAAEFPDECLGEPVRPGQPGYTPAQKVFHFNCHTQYIDASGTVSVP